MNLCNKETSWPQRSSSFILYLPSNGLKSSYRDATTVTTFNNFLYQLHERTSSLNSHFLAQTDRYLLLMESNHGWTSFIHHGLRVKTAFISFYAHQTTSSPPQPRLHLLKTLLFRFLSLPFSFTIPNCTTAIQ